MWGSSDLTSDSRVLDVEVREPSTTAEERKVAIERDYEVCRTPVCSMVRGHFPRLDDPEEIYHEAWAELLAMEARGEVIRNRLSLLKKVAWRRAADAIRDQRADAVDPASPELVHNADASPTPDVLAEQLLDSA